MCDRVSIIRGGEHVFQGRVNDLRDDRLGLRIQAEPVHVRDEVIKRFQGEPMPGGRIVFPLETKVSEIVAALVDSGAEVSEVTPVRRSLEDVYLEYSKAPSG